MKITVLIISLLTLSMCQEHYDPELPKANEKVAIEETTSHPNHLENNALTIEDKIFDKSKQLSSIKDLEYQQTGVVTTKQLIINEDLYELNYNYPYLDDEGYANFNYYIESKYLNIEKTVNQILDDKEMQCDVIPGDCKKDYKYLDFKIYSLEEEMLSVLMYQENFYAGVAHSSYAFECLNYSLEKEKFIKFDEFFKPNSAPKILSKINKKIDKGLKTGELYYECWQLTKDDFDTYKDNFVIQEEGIVYYFDDCIICPSFTGTYSVEIPTEEIIGLINMYTEKPVVTYVE